MLLKADEGRKDKEIDQALNRSVATIARIRQRLKKTTSSLGSARFGYAPSHPCL
jgi:hypothetical protein